MTCIYHTILLIHTYLQHTHIYTYAHIHSRTCMNIHICYAHAYNRTYTHTYTRTYTHTHTHIHTNIHTYLEMLRMVPLSSATDNRKKYLPLLDVWTVDGERVLMPTYTYIHNMHNKKTYEHMHTYIHTYIYTHTHTHIH